jgi:hypothetical protein
MIPMVKISQTKKTRVLYLACVLKYTAAKIRSFLKNGLYFGRPLYLYLHEKEIIQLLVNLFLIFLLHFLVPGTGTVFQIWFWFLAFSNEYGSHQFHNPGRSCRQSSTEEAQLPSNM